MKIWNLAIFFMLAAVNAFPSLSQTPESAQDANQESYNGINNNASDITENIFLDDCAKLENQYNPIKTIITTADIVQNCSKEITKLLHSSDGSVIIMGPDQSATALACSKLNTHKELFFNKYYDLPQSVQSLRDYIYSAVELDIKVYTTSQQSIIDKLNALIFDAKYDEAVKLSGYLYSSHPDHFTGKEIIKSVIKEILKNNMGYQIMNYAFKLFQNDKNIVRECFPGVFSQIFNEHRFKILNKEKKGVLRLTSETDSSEDRWLYNDCTNSVITTEPEDIYWKLNPVWNTTLNSVVFIIKNTFYEMKLKLDVNFLGHFPTERLAWGDHRRVDPLGRFSWRLMPVGFNEHNQLLFRLEDTIYNFCLSVSSCVSAKTDVKGSVENCTPNMGWILELVEPK